MNVLSKNPSDYKTVVFVDVLLSSDGETQQVQLSQPKSLTLFNRFALLKAKNQSYAIKHKQGNVISYWEKNIAMEFNFKALK
ncbi:MAG: hypothetical protein HRT54_22685 [Colwellia sp.]|nr:hypothetical protein [Colwellia sp.]